MEQRVQTLERDARHARPLSDAVAKGKGGLAVMNLLAVLLGGAVVAAIARLIHWGS